MEITFQSHIDATYWHLVYTKCKKEKRFCKGVNELGIDGVTTFLPLVKSVKYYNGKKRTHEVILFSSYVYVKVSPGDRRKIQTIPGYYFFINNSENEPVIIPQNQVVFLKKLTESGFEFEIVDNKINKKRKIWINNLDFNESLEGVLIPNGDGQIVAVEIKHLNKVIKIDKKRLDLL